MKSVVRRPGYVMSWSCSTVVSAINEVALVWRLRLQVLRHSKLRMDVEYPLNQVKVVCR
jgi:hypothetical protein